MVRRGSTVRVRQRALQRPRKTGSFVFGPTCTSRARSGVESVLEKRVLRRIPSRRLMERALEERAVFDAHSQMGQRRWNDLARAPERSSDARKAYARRVSEAGRDRRASSGGRATPHCLRPWRQSRFGDGAVVSAVGIEAAWPWASNSADCALAN